MGTVRETLAESTEGAHQFGPKRSRVYSDLTFEEKDRYNADIQATNILLQGLPKDIYTLINHYTDAKDIWDNKGESIQGLPKDIYTLINHYMDAKDIWDNVNMLLEGYEFTKDDRESQLYDDFEHFCQNKGETIHDYYIRFTKLGRFVTIVKVNRGLKESNHDQLYAYLKQHEVHTDENKILMERFTQPSNDPLAFVYNVLPYQYPSSSSASPQSSIVQPTSQSYFADNT
nr:hypothetical protein [Tanacetum cinerariifolium]